MTTPFAAGRRALIWLLLLGCTTGSALAQSALCVERDGKTYVVQKVGRGFAFIKEGEKLVPVKATRSGLVPVKEFYPLFVSVRNLEVKTSYVEIMQGGNEEEDEDQRSGSAALDTQLMALLKELRKKIAKIMTSARFLPIQFILR